MNPDWEKSASQSMDRLEPEMFKRSETRKRLVDRVRNALFPYKVAKSIDQFIYDVSVMTYVKLVKKAASKTALRKTDLSRKQIARIIEILQFFYERDIVYDVPSDLIKYFGHAPTFAEACAYFDKNIMGEHAFVPGYKFIADNHSRNLMCKDDHGHTFGEQHYMPSRGKRLPWIMDAIHRPRHAYITEQGPGGEEQLMVVNQYRYPISGTRDACEYFVVILRRLGQSVKTYRLVTAYGVNEYRGILRLLGKVLNKAPLADVSDQGCKIAGATG